MAVTTNIHTYWILNRIVLLTCQTSNIIASKTNKWRTCYTACPWNKITSSAESTPIIITLSALNPKGWTSCTKISSIKVFSCYAAWTIMIIVRKIAIHATWIAFLTISITILESMAIFTLCTCRVNTCFTFIVTCML